MGMPQTTHFWTPDEVRALPADGHRYEVVAGELLVTPAPSFSHQEATGRLLLALSAYLSQTQKPESFTLPGFCSRSETGYAVTSQVFQTSATSIAESIGMRGCW